MKKFILVVFIGIVLRMNLYAFINDILIDESMKEVDHIEDSTIAVFME